MEAQTIAEIIQQILTLISVIFGVESSVSQTAIAIIFGATTVIGSASLIVTALEKLAGITPSTRDDELVGKIKRAVGYISAVVDKIALNRNPDKE